MRICQRLQSVSAAQRRRPLAAAITTIETAHSAPTRTPYKNVKCSANWMREAKLEGEGAAMWDACEGMCDMMRRRRHGAAAAKPRRPLLRWRRRRRRFGASACHPALPPSLHPPPRIWVEGLHTAWAKIRDKTWFRECATQSQSQ